MAIFVVNNDLDVVVQNPEKKGLLTISPDYLYMVETQPYKLEKSLTPDIAYSRSKRISALLTCLVYYPNDFDNLFNIQVRPPYDQQTEDFANHLAAAINEKLDKDDTISESEIESMKEDIYKQRTYTHPFGVLMAELEDNQNYLTCKLNSEKMVVQPEEVELAEQSAKCFPKMTVAQFGDSRTHKNHQLVHEYIENTTARAFNLVAHVPVYVNSDTKNLFFAAHVEGNLTDKKYNFSLIEESNTTYEIGLISYILKATMPSSLRKFYLFLTDDWGNTILTQVGEPSVALAEAEAITSLTKAANIIKEPKMWRRYISKNMKNGVLTI